MSLIVLEGLDGSGKGTQFKILSDNLEKLNIKTAEVDFPDYNSNSSALVKMYLNGEFGEDPKNVNPYAACTFYAVDRFASYTNVWKKHIDDGKVIVANRYTSSNIVYQMSKLPKEEWDSFTEWVEETEYEKFGLPKPSAVIYLDMPIEISQKLMTSRYSGDDSKKDIHEKDIQFLKDCRECALFASKKLGWYIVECSENDEPKTIEDISVNILDIVKKILD